MRRFELRWRIWILLAALGWFSTGARASADESPAAPAEAATQLTARFTEISAAVLEQHLEAPARQQMLLDVARGLLAKYELPIPAELSRRISSLAGHDQIDAFLHELANQIPAEQRDEAAEALTQTLVASLPGECRLMTPEQYRLAKQFQDNQYEGIGIVLSQQDGRPIIAKPFLGGPARNAGAKSGDWIQEVDGVSTEGKDLGEVVQMLRGLSGEPLSIVVKHPDDDEPRRLDMVRGVIPFQNIVGLREVGEEKWDFTAGDDARIAYVNIKAIRSSIVQELQVVARKLRAGEFQALVLDLRQTEPGPPRHIALLADAFMGEGVVGRERTVHGEQVYKSRAVSDFAGWPMAVLIGPQTDRTVAWLAAALQDSGRAILVGQPTGANPYVLSAIELGSGEALVMPISILLRADGSAFNSPDPNALDRAIAAEMSQAIRRPRSPEDHAMAAAQMQIMRNGGVAPDHVAGDANQRVGPLVYRQTKPAEGEEKQSEAETYKPEENSIPPSDAVASSRDLALDKAVELLKAALQKQNQNDPA